MARKIVPVSVVVKYLKTTLDNAPGLHGVMVEGEISNLRKPASGHLYFSLKDDSASISCVMFAYQARKITFPIANGDKVILTGDVTVYVNEGRMQILAKDMRPSGIGELYLQFEALKKKLSEEGLFNPLHKKKIPSYATDIALVSGNQTAAREDVLITFQKRWPLARITEYPAPVQGDGAAAKIIESLKTADENHHDLIILARGGGSLEDLWCFNDESLARFIYQMQTPVITGIGHETDTTLVDYVSDLRANTPTGAVQVAVPDQFETEAMLAQLRMRMIRAMHNKYNIQKQQYTRLASANVLQHPEKIVSEPILKLDQFSQRLLITQKILIENRQEFQQLFQSFHQQLFNYSNLLRRQLNEKQNQLVLSTRQTLDTNQHELSIHQENLQKAIQFYQHRQNESLQKKIGLLDAYSPLKVLQRGYSVTYQDDKVIHSIHQVNVHDDLSIRLSDGTVSAKIEEIQHGTGNKNI